MELEGRKATQPNGIRALLTLSLAALGIIYSDIATSPLYVLTGIFPAAHGMPSNEDVIGGISAIVWALTLLPLIKYSFIALSFGTHEGEGGVFALFIGLFPLEQHTEYEGRALTGYSTKGTSSGQGDFKPRFGEKFLRAKMRVVLMVWAFLGVSLVLADGVLTPAVSVVSAVGGIAVAKPSVLNAVAPISVGFLVLLFCVQRFGTHRIGLCFGPVCLIWHFLLAGMGIVNIVAFPEIFRALDPSRAIMYFVRTKKFDALAGVVLAVTGCEAIFANLGQFTPSSIRMGFVCAYVALVLTYLGQGARIIVDGEDVLASPFYKSIPGPTGGGLYWIVFAWAILACLIASQTMITASFSLLQQLISMNCFPAIRMRYTSEQQQGQIYFPAINYLLLIAVVGTIAGFGTDYALTNAYGFAVSTVMFITTTLIAVQMAYVKRLPWAVTIAFIIFFGFVEGLFFGATISKVPHGAWFTLAIGGVLTIILCFFTWARNLESTYDSSNTLQLSRIIFRSPHLSSPRLHVGHLPNVHSAKVAGRPATSSEIQEEGVDDGPFFPPSTLDERLWLAPFAHEDDEHGGESDVSLKKRTNRLELPRISAVAVFHKSSSSIFGVPSSFYAFLRRWPSLPRVVIFLSTRVVGLAHVDFQDRYSISKVRSLEGFYGVTMRIGYRDSRVADFNDILPFMSTIEASFDSKEAPRKLVEIAEAARTCTHILPNYTLLAKNTSNGPISAIRRLCIEELYGRLRTMFPDENSVSQGSEEVIRVGLVAHV